MLNALEKTLKRNLLKYVAGRAITCASCGAILDYRSMVSWTSPAGQTGANCSDCWRKGLDKVHDDRPHAYLLSIGWQVDTLVDFEKKPKAMQTTLFTLKTPNGEFHVKPENLAKVQKHLDSKPKAKKPKADKRLFPCDSNSLRSTRMYVEAYLRLNAKAPCHGGVGLSLVDDGTVYSDSPTVWPDHSLDTVEQEVE